MNDLEHMLRQAVHEIRNLRRANEVLSAQVAVVETFRAAILGAPRGGGMSPDIAWEMERYLERDQPETAKRESVE
jgi:hypothetical protein